MDDALKVTPEVVTFPPPLERVMSHIVRLQNTSTKDFLTYKVKTTAPKRYSVRPNLGVIAPGDTAEVQVILNYLKDPLPPNQKCKDRFQIQSIVTENSEFNDHTLKEFWKDIDEAKVKKQKLKCRLGNNIYQSPVRRKSEETRHDSNLFNPDQKDNIKPTFILPESPLSPSTTESFAHVLQDRNSLLQKVKELKQTVEDVTTERDKYKRQINELRFGKGNPLSPSKLQQYTVNADKNSGGLNYFHVCFLLFVVFFAFWLGKKT